MNSNENDAIIESYWELLKNLDANTRLALIARLAQSLQSDATPTDNFFPVANSTAYTNTGSITTNTAEQQPNNDSDTFWWESLED